MLKKIEREQEDSSLSRTNTEALKPTLSIDGNKTNFLVYGENGSGKSSIFQGLQDFFASSQNPTLNFNLNRFAKGNIPQRPVKPLERDIPYIKVIFDDSSEALFSEDESITNSHTEQYDFIKTANKGKGFLSYKELLKVHFLSGNPINLFELLIGKELDNGQVQEGLLYHVENPIFAKSGDAMAKKAIGDLVFTLYPYKERYSRRDKVNKINKDLLEDINDGIKQILTSFYQTLSDMLQKFSPKNENGIATFRLEPFEVEELTSNNIKTGRITPKIIFQDKNIPDFNEFLNEARLTSLAICIYLASLKTIPERTYKILFLDDVFIGLDMGNRIPLLAILKEYFADYQVFITTYDRHWFEIAKDYLPDSWASFEMYVGKKGTQNLDIPAIIQSKNHYERAWEYFKSFDYPASGNYLRKDCENIIKQIFHRQGVVVYLIKNDGTIRDNFGELFEALNSFFEDCNVELPQTMMQGFKIAKNAILNPTSHDDLKSPIYKSELQSAFDFSDALRSLTLPTKRLLLPSTAILEYTDASSGTVFEIKLNENIFWVNYESRSFIPKLIDTEIKAKAYFCLSNGSKTINLTLPNLAGYIRRQTHTTLDENTFFYTQLSFVVKDYSKFIYPDSKDFAEFWGRKEG